MHEGERMRRTTIVPLGWLRSGMLLGGGLAAVLALSWAPAGAQTTRGALIVTITDSPDPAASGGQVTYSVEVLNDGTEKATNVVVTAPVPAGTQFIKCSTSTQKSCAQAGGTVTGTIGDLKAHDTEKVSVVLAMPTLPPNSTSTATVTFTARANGDNVSDDGGSQSTTVLPSTANVELLPSTRQATVNCGATLDAAFFKVDTTVRFLGGLGCATSPVALTVTAPGTTVDFNKFKMIGGALKNNLGNIGVRVVNAPNVTITASGKAGNNGLEYFDYPVKDDGGNDGLKVTLLRIFRGRSAGVQVASNGVTLSSLLIDKTVTVSGATAEAVGGVGIHAMGNTHIQNCIVRRSGTIGIWADGTYQDANGRVVTIDGNTTTMQVQSSADIGIQLDFGPHSLKATQVTGDGVDGTSTDGVVIGPTGTGNTIDGVVVKNHGGNGFVIDGVSNSITRSTADTSVGLDGFWSTGSGTVLSGNTAQAVGNGFVIDGPDNVLNTNTADVGGDGFVVSGDRASLSANRSKTGSGVGFVVKGTGGTFNTNLAQSNSGDGFKIPGTGNTFSSNRSKTNKGNGYDVSGSGNHLGSNSAQMNTGSEWIIAPGNFDDGGNRKNGAGFPFTTAGGTFN